MDWVPVSGSHAGNQIFVEDRVARRAAASVRTIAAAGTNIAVIAAAIAETRDWRPGPGQQQIAIRIDRDASSEVARSDDRLGSGHRVDAEDEAQVCGVQISIRVDRDTGGPGGRGDRGDDRDVRRYGVDADDSSQSSRAGRFVDDHKEVAIAVDRNAGGNNTEQPRIRLERNDHTLSPCHRIDADDVCVSQPSWPPRRLAPALLGHDQIAVGVDGDAGRRVVAGVQQGDDGSHARKGIHLQDRGGEALP